MVDSHVFWVRILYTHVKYDNETDEFDKIHKLYELRKSNENDDSAQEGLTQAFYYFVSLQADKAIAIVDSIGQLE